MVVEVFLQRLRTPTLTAKPSKCFIGFSSLECLGDIAGNEKLKTIPDKVEAIQNCSRPTTKKQVKSFLGLVGFYQKFIPNISQFFSCCVFIVVSDQERTTEVVWGETVASDIGIEAVLLQYENGIKKPFGYASKKLTSSPTKYSTVETECFAIIIIIIIITPLQFQIHIGEGVKNIMAAIN